MSINALYRNYFQKSKIFVYPLLGIKKGSSVTPVQTYFGWNDYVIPEDMKLVTVFHARTDQDYIDFEKNVLLKHNRLNDYIIKVNDLFCRYINYFFNCFYHFFNSFFYSCNYSFFFKRYCFFYNFFNLRR